MASTVPWIRLSAGLALGLILGYAIRRAVQQVRVSGRVTIEPVASPAFALVSAVAAFWVLSINRSASPYATSAPRLPHIVLTHTIHLLGMYCVGGVIGFLGSQHYPIPGKRWVVLLLDVSAFGTVGYQFATRVLGNSGMSLLEPPVYQAGQLIIAAGAFGLLVTIIHHCALMGEWVPYLLTALSVLSLVCIDVPQWLRVMRRGFVYTDMAQAFVHGLDRCLTSLLV